MVEIEAESLGKGLIATDLGFSEEAIVNGVNGFKVPLGNVNGFERIIRELWANSEQIVNIGKNARMDYEAKYQPENNYQKMMEIYKSTMEEQV